MKSKNPVRYISLLLLSVFSLVLGAQDLQKLKYEYYTSWFSASEHIPIVVTYTLTGKMVSCSDPAKRTNKFKPDPDHKSLTNLARDYRGSGYDRGHNMPAADNKCSDTGMEQCFYFSNMTPQPHSFNAGRWKDLETQERNEAVNFKTIIVTCGSLGVKETIGEDKVVVPKKMWKVIYIPSSGKYECYVFPNDEEVNKELIKYSVKKSVIEEQAGVRFNKGAVEVLDEAEEEEEVTE